MNFTKKQVLEVVGDLPQPIEMDDLTYRRYLKTKIEAAEEDIRKGRTIPHAKVMKEIERWLRSGGRKKLRVI